MGKIFCIMGKSSSGKDTIYKRVLETPELSLKHIIPYTTRPARSGEKNGVEYYFSDEQQLEQLLAEHKVIELRAYHTVYGIWKYFTVDDGQIRLDRQNYLMITTLEAYEKLLAYFGRDAVVPLYIEVEDGIRLERALRREQREAEPHYAEMCRRFLADEQDFSEEKLHHAGIGRRFRNDDLEVTCQAVSAYIGQMSGIRTER